MLLQVSSPNGNSLGCCMEKQKKGHRGALVGLGLATAGSPEHSQGALPPPTSRGGGGGGDSHCFREQPQHPERRRMLSHIIHIWGYWSHCGACERLPGAYPLDVSGAPGLCNVDAYPSVF